MADKQDVNKGGGQPKFSTSAAGYKGGFTALPNAVLHHRDLSGNAKLLYALMLDATWREAEPEMEELGGELGGGVKTARTAIRELEAAGLVTSKRRGQGLTNAYVVHAPDEPQTVPEGQSKPAAEDAPLLQDTGENTEVEDKSSTSAGRPVKDRKRSPVFDALAESTGANPSASGGQIAKALKAIKDAEAPALAAKCEELLAAHPEMEEVPPERIEAYLAEKIRARATRYREMRPEWELTPTALASHWLRIPTWQPRGDAGDDAAEQAWQRVLAGSQTHGETPPGKEMTARDRAALKAIGGSFTIRTSTHLPTVRRQFINAWDAEQTR